MRSPRLYTAQALRTAYAVVVGLGETSDAAYGGRGICYLEFGNDELALVDVTFFGDQKSGTLVGPSAEYRAEKEQFGSSRIKRWFNREWSNAAT